jgi:plastocyanin
MKRLFALLALFALYSVSSATIHNVVLSGISFTPRNLTIQQGDTVRWTNQGGFHNVAEVSTPPVFRSGDPTSANFTYQFIFAAPLTGTFSYECEVHAPSMSGTITVEAGGSAPDAPTYLGPQNGATNQPLDGVITWNTAQGADHYIVRLGTSNPPAIVVSNHMSTAFNYSGLTAGTQYFWQIISENDFGTGDGNIWSFTTADVPGAATNPFPTNNATNVPVNTLLGWDAGDGATSYGIYLGTAEPLAEVGATTETTFTLPSNLNHSTTYIWRVEAQNQIGEAMSDTWTFTTEAASAVDDVALPASFEVSEAYPNPFNSNVRINLSIAAENIVNVKVYDILGQEVSTLVNSKLSAGQHVLEWNANGHAAGLYLMRCDCAGLVQTQKLIYLP